MPQSFEKARVCISETKRISVAKQLFERSYFEKQQQLGFNMRVRKLCAEKKTIVHQTPNWSTDDLPPRHAPYLSRTMPIKAGWKWRAARAEAQGGNYFLTARCNPDKDNWQAVLSVETGEGISVIGRLESHGSHPGLHVHAHCDRSGIEIGSQGLDRLQRVPPASNRHRRVHAWTERSFWEAAKVFFRVKDSDLPLFTDDT
ncbi:hypothetical protein FLX56_09930 [Synechococcus moorigangaii CMS01]|nr:hypothetical protein [Synechococcus moorigangaii CMS01]